MSSFQRRKKEVIVSGSKPSLQNGQLIVSSGNPCMDSILGKLNDYFKLYQFMLVFKYFIKITFKRLNYKHQGGGLPLGSILLIEEDKYGTYCKSLVKYFLAEGVVHKNALFLASLDDDCHEFVK